MTAYKPGDVVLVSYPLGQGSSAKKRPALVISPEDYNQAAGELIIAQITSRVSAPPRPGDYRIQDWQEAKLPCPALVRARLATLKASQVLRKLGELGEGDLRAIRMTLQTVLGS
jgi:mRNA interferase MazF